MATLAPHGLRPRHAIRTIALACAVLALAGCGAGDRTLAPTLSSFRNGGAEPSRLLNSPGAGFPLASGNAWEFRGELREYRLAPDGSENVTLLQQSRTRWSLRCVEPHAGAEYLVQEARNTRVSGTGVVSVTTDYDRLRQDASGLYEFPRPAGAVPDCIGSESTGRAVETAHAEGVSHGLAAFIAGSSRLAAPDRRAPGAPPPGEFTWLRYPLHAGASWTVRPTSTGVLTATVEGLDVLDLPTGREPAWRVRYRGGPGHPRLEVRAWVGRAGFVQFEERLPPPFVDSSGNPFGFASLYRESLVSRTSSGD